MAPGRSLLVPVIEISDDESPAAARPGNQLPSASARKTLPVKHSNKSVNEPSSTSAFARQLDMTTPPKNKGAQSSKHAPSSGSQPTRKGDPPKFVPASNGKPRKSGDIFSNAPRSSSQPMPKRPAETIDLLESDEEDRPRMGKNGFVLPRALSFETGEARSTSVALGDKSTAGRQKRQLERDSPNDGAASFKRVKLSSEHDRTPDLPFRASSNPRVDSTASSPTVNKRQKAPVPRDRLAEELDLSTPAAAKKHGSQIDTRVKSRTSSPGLKETNGVHERPQKSMTSLPKPRDPIEPISRSGHGQEEQTKPPPSLHGSSVERPKTKAEQDEEMLAKLLKTTKTVSTLRDGRAATPQKRTEATNRQEAVSSKAGTPAIPESIKPSPAIPSSLPKVPDQGDQRNDRTPQISQQGKSPQPSWRRQAENAPATTTGASKDITEATLANEVSPDAATPSKRKVASEEDQGYVSLSSNNDEVHRSKAGKPTSGRVVQPHETVRSIELLPATEPGVTGDDHAKATRASSHLSAHNKVAPSRRITEAEEADLQLQSEASEAIRDSMVNDVTMRDSESAFTQPTVTASALRKAALYSRLSLANRVEKILGGYLEELLVDNEYWTSVSLQRARLTKEDARRSTTLEPSKQDEEKPASFANLKPLRFSPVKKGSPMAKSDGVWGVQRMSSDGKPHAHTEMSAPYTIFATDKQDVPDYAHYVSIQDNLLAPNVIHLHCWPYFGDDFDMRDALNLDDQYNIDITDRERKLLLLNQAQKYEEYVESALQDLEISWVDVLRFLLELNPNVGTDPDARRANQNRPQYCQKDFKRESPRWIAVCSALPSSTPEKLGRAAVLCENFQKMAKFSLWHIARRSELCNLPEETPKRATTQLPDDNELTCRICLRFDCPYHGQFRHHPDDSGGEDDDQLMTVDDVVRMDVVHPLKANHRSRISFPSDAAHAAKKHLPDPLLRKKQKDHNYWSNYKHKAEDRGPFYPCHHPGESCAAANCSCFVKMIPCEKTCGCAHDCPRKFKGCSCGLKKGHQLVCYENPDCICWHTGRECDPDLCGSCGVCDVVDPMNKYNDAILVGRCRNASIQRGVPKHMLLGDSGVHGLGLYACEDIRHNHFVGEYKGEIITKKEADRRGAVYEYQKLSYLFSLNMSQEIDSTYFGNKVRFINHAHGDKANLYPRIIMVNTVHRIALYAGRDIPAGKELLFDYGPFFPDEQLQGKKSKKTAPESKKSAPHVRNANLVKEFYDVSESEDEDGMLRAKAVSRTNNGGGGAKGKAKGKKPCAANSSTRVGTATKKSHVPTATKSSFPPALPDDGDDMEPEQHEDIERDAGERLAAFNISDDVEPDVGAGGREEEDEDGAFEPDEEESVPDSDESEEGVVRSEFDDYDDDEVFLEEEGEEDEDEEGEVRNAVDRRRRRGAVDLRHAIRR